jgi:hypothetical protein
MARKKKSGTRTKRKTSRTTAGGAGRRKSARGSATRPPASRGETTARRQSEARGQRTARGAPARRAGAQGGARGATSLLSRSTARAKWVNAPDEHEDVPGQTLATRNHDVIRRWAEARGAIPATVPGTEHDDRPGVLTFDFPGYGGERLRHISWDEWFRTFDERNLVFLFQEHLKNGRPSNHFNLDSPEREAA